MARIAARRRYTRPPLDMPQVVWASLVPGNPRFDSIGPSAELANAGAEAGNDRLREAFEDW